MKKKYIVAVVIAVVALVVIVVITNPFANGNANIPNGSSNSTTGDNSTTNTTNPDRPPNTSNWIHPGKIYVDNYEPGETVVLELEVHNGNAEEATFSVDYRYPDNVSEGYELPTGASDWVRSKEKFITIGARETYIAKVWLHMPSDATPPGPKWEFWIGVIDKSQMGMIITELAARVLVTMK